jgi:glycosyltransferase involved in cell wall biosynthesis
LIERLPSHAGQGAALNHAIDMFPADVYAFTDSDCVVADNWIQAIDLGAAHLDDTVGTCGPPWRHLQASTRLGRWLTDNESRLVETCFRPLIDVDERTTRLDCRNLWLRGDQVKPGWFPEDAGAALSRTVSRLVAERGEHLRFDPSLTVFHAPILSVVTQALTYYQRGRTSDLSKHYAAGHRNLAVALARTYWRRHFVQPVSSGVHPTYVALVHGAYWAGLARRRPN